MSAYGFVLTASFALGYLLGSIPFGLLLTKLAGGPDLRAVGSGNIGATNVLRSGSKKLAAATLAGDMLKGTVAVLAARYFLPAQYFDAPPPQYFDALEPALLAALGAFLGHLFPVWLGFKGGKGVATYIGLLLGLAWPIALAFCAIWAAVAAATRYSSLSALIASAATPALLLLIGRYPEALLFLALTALLWLMHRDNITRLLAGSEGKIGL